MCLLVYQGVRGRKFDFALNPTKSNGAVKRTFIMPHQILIILILHNSPITTVLLSWSSLNKRKKKKYYGTKKIKHYFLFVTA